MMPTGEKRYPPKKVCALLEIPRTTLFRWEAKGKIPRPDRMKGAHAGRRTYSCADLSQIAAKCLEIVRDKRQSRARAEFMARVNLFVNPEEALRQLQALSQLKPLSDKTLRVIAEFALDLTRGGKLRSDLLELL